MQRARPARRASCIPKQRNLAFLVLCENMPCAAALLAASYYVNLSSSVQYVRSFNNARAQRHAAPRKCHQTGEPRRLLLQQLHAACSRPLVYASNRRL
jgi:hypothetical protein